MGFEEDHVIKNITPLAKRDQPSPLLEFFGRMVQLQGKRKDVPIFSPATELGVGPQAKGKDSQEEFLL